MASGVEALGEIVSNKAERIVQLRDRVLGEECRTMSFSSTLPCLWGMSEVEMMVMKEVPAT